MKLSGYYVHGSDLSWPLKKIFINWRKILEDQRYYEKSNAAWWYNERASLSQLAGSVWKAGGYVLEEYSNLKWGKKRKGKWSKKTGRIDMRFVCDGFDCIAEAKQCWPTLTSSAKKIKGKVQYTKHEMNIALGDARNLVREVKSRKLGILFATPKIHVNDRNESEKIISDYLEGLNSIAKENNWAIAWCFPMSKITKVKYKDHYYPGQVIISRYVRKK